MLCHKGSLLDEQENWQKVWGPPRVERVDEIKEPILKKCQFLKVKSEGRLESNIYYITSTKLYYANALQPTKLKGQLSLPWMFIKFIVPETSESDEELKIEQESDENSEEKSQSDESGSDEELSEQLPEEEEDIVDDLLSPSRAFRKYHKSSSKLFEMRPSSPTLRRMSHVVQGKLVLEHGQAKRVDKMIQNIAHNQERKRLSMISRELVRVNPPIASEGDSQKQYYIIRFFNANRFSEIATYDDKIFKEWSTLLKKLCLQAEFNLQFKKERLLSKGRSSVIYLVNERKTGERYCAKTFSAENLKLNDDLRERVINEIRVYRRLRYQGIVKLLSIFEDPLAIYMIFEYIEGPTIEATFKLGFEFRNRDIYCFLFYCLDTLSYLHAQNISHRDINPLSIILSKVGWPGPYNYPYIIGLSKSLENSILQEKGVDCKVGRLGYMAPEMLRSTEGTGLEVDFFKADIFSLGLVMYSLMAGREPFSHESTGQLYLANTIYLPLDYNSRFEQFSKSLQVLVKWMLDKDPNKRPTVFELLKVDLLQVETIRKLEDKFDMEQRNMDLNCLNTPNETDSMSEGGFSHKSKFSHKSHKSHMSGKSRRSISPSNRSDTSKKIKLGERSNRDNRTMKVMHVSQRKVLDAIRQKFHDQANFKPGLSGLPAKCSPSLWKVIPPPIQPKLYGNFSSTQVSIRREDDKKPKMRQNLLEITNSTNPIRRTRFEIQAPFNSNSTISQPKITVTIPKKQIDLNEGRDTTKTIPTNDDRKSIIKLNPVK